MARIELGSDVCLVKVENKFVEGWEPIKDLKQLMSLLPMKAKKREGIKWIGAKIPAKTMQDILGTAAQFPHTETGYSLCYSITKGEWLVVIPNQTAGGAHVTMQPNDLPEGFVEIGEIHTHPNMAARWSQKDKDDLLARGGVHFVFGLLNGRLNEVTCSLTTPSGLCYDLEDLDEVCEHFDWKAEYPPNKNWVAKIQKCHEEMRKEASKPLPPLVRPSYADTRSQGGYAYDYPTYSYNEWEYDGRYRPWSKLPNRLPEPKKDLSTGANAELLFVVGLEDLLRKYSLRHVTDLFKEIVRKEKKVVLKIGKDKNASLRSRMWGRRRLSNRQASSRHSKSDT